MNSKSNLSLFFLTLLLCFSFLPICAAEQMDGASIFMTARDVEAKIAIEPCNYLISYHFDLKYAIDPVKIAKDTMLLEIGHNTQHFHSRTAEQKDSTYYIKSVIEKEAVHSYDNGQFALYWDLLSWSNENKRKVSHRVGKIDFYHEETIDYIEWKLHSEETNILGYRCQKATTTYQGKTWTAWYTLELPLNYGPWKLRGLPGLILKAHDADTSFSWKAIEILQPINRKIYNYDNSGKYKKNSDDSIYVYEERKISKKDFGKLWKRRWLDSFALFFQCVGGMYTYDENGNLIPYKIDSEIISDEFYPEI